MHQNDVVDHDAVVALLDAHWSRHVNELLMMIVMMMMMITSRARSSEGRRGEDC